MWDIRYYFACRGGENIPTMMKQTFKLSTDPNTGIKYIEKAIDEETKNYKETDGCIITGFMPEMQNDHKMCPITSYLTYLYSLTKDNDNLWQAPKFTNFPEDPRKRTYYGPGNVGHNTHEKFVSKIAEKNGLKEFNYMDHSLRVSATTNLTRKKYTNKKIMAITGHKSSSSLEAYQHVSASEKISMGLSLGESLITSQQLVPYVTPIQEQDPSTPHLHNAIPANLPVLLPLDNNIQQDKPPPATLEMPDQELINIIQQTESENQELVISQQKEIATFDRKSKQVMSTNTTATKKSSPQIPMMFSGCTIQGNVTINFNK